MALVKTWKQRYTGMIAVTGPAGTLLVGCVMACGVSAVVGLIAGGG